MKTSLFALCLTLSACGTVGLQHSTPPVLAADAPAADVFEAWRSYADATERVVLVHLGAPW